jgi:hypothetical protein
VLRQLPCPMLVGAPDVWMAAKPPRPPYAEVSPSPNMLPAVLEDAEVPAGLTAPVTMRRCW